MIQLPQAAIDDDPSVSTHVRHAVLARLCIAAAISYVCRQSIGIAESTIRADLELSKGTMGIVMAMFYLLYAFGQIPGGMLSERWGSRRSIPLLAIGWSTATAAMAAAVGAPMLIAAWLANGLFQAGVFPSCAISISKWFPASRRAFASGMLASFMSLGGVVGSATMGFLIGNIGWRLTFICFGIPGIIWAIEFHRWFRNEPEQHPSANAAEVALIRDGKSISTAPKSKASAPWRTMLSNPATWCIFGQQFCRAAGQMLFGSWFATYLQEARGVTVAMSGVLNSLPQIAIIAGAALGGMVSDYVLARTGSRRLARQGVAASCMFCCAGFAAVAYVLISPLAAVLTLSAGSLFAAIGGPSAYAVTMDLGGRHVAKLFSCMNMVGNLGAALFVVGVPFFLKQTGNWNAVLITFGVLYIAAGVFWLLLNPNREIFGKENSDDHTQSGQPVR